MAYKYHSRRSARRLARKSSKNFIVTLIIVGLLIYATINWLLPNFIGGVGSVKNILQPSQHIAVPKSEAIAPPVLNIPYEATNSASISIKGYGTPNSKVKLYIDDEGMQTVNVSSDGSFTFEEVYLILGINNIYGKTLNDKGEESLPSKTIKLVFDNEKPNLQINEPEDGKKIQGGDKKIKVAGKTEIGTKVFINGNQTIVDKDGNFSQDQSLNDGDNTISIKAADAAGNITEIQRSVNYTP